MPFPAPFVVVRSRFPKVVPAAGFAGRFFGAAVVTGFGAVFGGAVFVGAVLGGAGGCVPDPPAQAPVAFALPTDARADFLDAPWPSDIMVRKDGTLNLSTFPNPYNSQTLEDFLAIFELAPGYSRNSTLAFRIAADTAPPGSGGGSGAVDESTLPVDAAASVDDAAALFVVELDSKRRLPIEWQSYPEGTSFYPPGTVAVNFLPGVVPAGPFALVVTSAAHRKDGAPLGPSADLRALLECADDAAALKAAADVNDLDCRVYQQLASDLGLVIDDVALVQKVTPQDTLPQFLSSYAAAATLVPTISGIQRRAFDARDPYTIYDGVITLARFQAGEPPYDRFDGSSGGFVYDGPELVDGMGASPTVQAEEQVAFVLTVPKREMPADGWPVVINGHGTGGDLQSGLGRRAGSEAFHITAAGAAMLAISEPLHLGRDGYREGQENVLTFNFFNPLAGRDNWRQSALEKVQLVTAVGDLDFIEATDQVRFNDQQIGYFGHSQGGIVGGQFVPMEIRLRGALLSGAGGGFASSMVEKVDPPPAIADILRLVLGMPDDEDIDLFHPVPAILQTFVDAADPLNYGARWQETQRATPRHLVVTSGLQDSFTPRRNHAAMAGAFHLPLAEPVFDLPPAIDLLGIGTVGERVSGNQQSDAGEPETVCMVQFETDGHFAVFENPIGQRLFSEYFTSLFQGDGVPTVSTR